MSDDRIAVVRAARQAGYRVAMKAMPSATRVIVTTSSTRSSVGRPVT